MKSNQSFSGRVRQELIDIIPSARHCRMAELAALTQCLPGKVLLEPAASGSGTAGNFAPAVAENGTPQAPEKAAAPGVPALVVFREGNRPLLEKYFTLIRKTTNIESIFPFAETTPGIPADLFRDEVLRMLKFVKSDGTYRDPEEGVSPLLIEKECCRRSFLRGMFLAAGSISDPEKEYHLEFVCERQGEAEQVRRVLARENIRARIVKRRKLYVVYLKDSEEISDLLTMMGAEEAILSLQNQKILREIANTVNRRVNCETSNLMKTVSAAQREIDDIEFIAASGGLGKLPDSLREMAEVRLEHRDATLKELGSYLDPPVGRSGVNHRLRRLSEYADKLRGSAADV